MRLYVLDDNNLLKFSLPQKVDGSFLFQNVSQKSHYEILLNIDAIENQWILKSNNSVTITNGEQNYDTIVLRDYAFIPLRKSNNELIFLTTLPTLCNKWDSYSLNSISNISIGAAPESQISIAQHGVFPNHVKISFIDGTWYFILVNKSAKAYCNDKVVNGSVVLHGGDILFIQGVKIVWMSSFFLIHSVPGKVVIHGLDIYSRNTTNNNSETPVVSDEDSMLELYRDEDYFSHTPRIRSILENEVVVIDAPPDNQDKEDDLPFILSMGTSITMLGSAFMSGYTVVYGLVSGTRDIVQLLPNIIMLITMVIGAVLVPQLMKKYRKKKSKEREALRQNKYSAYLRSKETEIQNILKKQAQIMIENNLSLTECQRIVEQSNNRQLWNREISDEDFLTLRLGVGNCPAKLTIQAPQEHFSLDEDNLMQRVYKLDSLYDTLEKVPITVSLVQERICALIFESSFDQFYLNGIFLQLLALHSAQELKIVLFFTKEDKTIEDYFAFIPHCWSDDRSVRFYARNQEEAKVVNNYLEKEYMTRQESVGQASESKDQYTKFSSYYLIITNDFKNIKEYSSIMKILDSEVNLGFSLLVVDHSLKNLPKECSKYIYICDTESGLFNNELTKENAIRFNAEYDKQLDMRTICNKLMNIPIKSRESVKELPNILYFLEMYNVGKIEQLNVLNRWSTNDTYTSLQAPIGVHENGDIFKLDLHEKASGPHGLIAGSTGSGKSEFIITYILSMAINYHPDDVQFVLIDYKGGGLAGAFENKEAGISIPHLAGTITNLDTNEMNRTLVSIESELKRRQRKFNEVREATGESTMDIYKYQKMYHEGIIKEPISHLFIISDEFAELKSQQPEFMAQLISASRIGRSLGIHLILATQKPTGVVNDQIWSNSRFKVCLKVQSRSDSMEMLKRPEAASIKQTGRFYLQVGYDESFDLGQSAWAGAKYIPADKIVRKIDDSINFINTVGDTVKTINNVPRQEVEVVDYGDQLTNIVKYLNDIANREGIKRHSLWLSSLPANIYLEDLIKKYQYSTSLDHISTIIGEYDAPNQQVQGLFRLNLLEDGNTLIYGIAGSGKENLLITYIYSLIKFYSPSEVQFYIGDFGSETLKIFQNFPHVGDVFTIDESNKLNNFLKMIDKEMEYRKKLFADFGGSYQEYVRQNQSIIPLIVVALNGFENFLETYPRMQDAFDTYFRDGVKYGIVFVVTTSLASSIRMKISQQFLNKICLHMPNNTDYRDILGAPRGLVPNDNFGRGILAIGEVCLEFQTAFICPRDEINNFLKNESQKFIVKYPISAKKIPVLPDIVYAKDIVYELKGLTCVPIGIERTTLEIYVYDFTLNQINLVVAKFLINHIYFLYGLVSELLHLDNVSIEVIDALGIFKQNYPNVSVVTNDFMTCLNNLYSSKSFDSLNSKIYIFIGIEELYGKVNEEGKSYIRDIFINTSQYQNSIFIIASDYSSLKKLQVEEWYRENVDNSYGIWLGEDVGSQMVLSIATLTVEDKSLIFPCISFIIYKGSHMIVKYVVDGVELQNEK